METLITHGHIQAAHRALDEYVSEHTTRTRLDVSSPLALICPPELANMLENDGYHSVGSVIHETDERLLCVAMLGPKRLKQLRRALRKHGFGPPMSALELLQGHVDGQDEHHERGRRGM